MNDQEDTSQKPNYELYITYFIAWLTSAVLFFLTYVWLSFTLDNYRGSWDDIVMFTAYLWGSAFYGAALATFVFWIPRFRSPTQESSVSSGHLLCIAIPLTQLVYMLVQNQFAKNMESIETASNWLILLAEFIVIPIFWGTTLLIKPLPAYWKVYFRISFMQSLGTISLFSILYVLVHYDDFLKITKQDDYCLILNAIIWSLTIVCSLTAFVLSFVFACIDIFSKTKLGWQHWLGVLITLALPLQFLLLYGKFIYYARPSHYG